MTYKNVLFEWAMLAIYVLNYFSFKLYVKSFTVIGKS